MILIIHCKVNEIHITNFDIICKRRNIRTNKSFNFSTICEC